MNLQGIFPLDKWDFNSRSILPDLPKEDFNMLTRHQSLHTYGKGEVIFREGAYPTGIFYIRTGMAKKYKVDADGKEQIIYVAKSGELIGYHAILSDDRYPDSAAAMEKSIVAFIPREDFLETVQKSDVLSKRLLKTLSHEFAVMINSLTLYAQRTVRERLALQLVLLREKYKQQAQPGQPVEINWSRDDLASLVGTARENVVRMLTEFKEAGILETRGRKIVVHDVRKLVEISNYR
ncbi:MAG TPA: Crp/Fnr family transcriptional regulator [Puia sp.]|nr:Crp/Fnr family transcriptional regulator [Puia sp.]